MIPGGRFDRRFETVFVVDGGDYSLGLKTEDDNELERSR